MRGKSYITDQHYLPLPGEHIPLQFNSTSVTPESGSGSSRSKADAQTEPSGAEFGSTETGSAKSPD